MVSATDANRWWVYRSKSSLSTKGEIGTHQLYCAVFASARKGVIWPDFVAAIRASDSACAITPSVSQITRYLVKARRGGGDVAGVGASRKRCAAIQPGKARTSLICFASAVSHGKFCSLIAARKSVSIDRRGDMRIHMPETLAHIGQRHARRKEVRSVGVAERMYGHTALITIQLCSPC